MTWFRINLFDTTGYNLASWDYDSQFPVTSLKFTYPNNSHANPYLIEFRNKAGVIYRRYLATCTDLNLAITDAIRHHVEYFA